METDSDGWTPLYMASWNGHADVVQLLLEKGVDVSIEDRNGWSALQLAALNGQEAVEKLFVIHGSPEIEDLYGLQKLFLVE